MKPKIISGRNDDIRQKKQKGGNASRTLTSSQDSQSIYHGPYIGVK